MAENRHIREDESGAAEKEEGICQFAESLKRTWLPISSNDVVHFSVAGFGRKTAHSCCSLVDLVDIKIAL